MESDYFMKTYGDYGELFLLRTGSQYLLIVLSYLSRILMIAYVYITIDISNVTPEE